MSGFRALSIIFAMWRFVHWADPRWGSGSHDLPRRAFATCTTIGGGAIWQAYQESMRAIANVFVFLGYLLASLIGIIQ